MERTASRRRNRQGFGSSATAASAAAVERWKPHTAGHARLAKSEVKERKQLKQVWRESIDYQRLEKRERSLLLPFFRVSVYAAYAASSFGRSLALSLSRFLVLSVAVVCAHIYTLCFSIFLSSLSHTLAFSSSLSHTRHLSLNPTQAPSLLLSLSPLPPCQRNSNVQAVCKAKSMMETWKRIKTAETTRVGSPRATKQRPVTDR